MILVSATRFYENGSDGSKNIRGEKIELLIS
jgi:hypothetical protein